MRRRKRLARIWIAVGSVVAVLTVAVIVSASVTVPYYLISPGSSRPTEPLIQISGTETYTNPGQIDFTTVSQRHATALEALIGWLDPTVDVIDESIILGGKTPQQSNQENLQEMLDSKQVATAVALEHLGYDVIHGTGAVVAQVVPDSPAAGTLNQGDVIVGIDGQQVKLASDVADLIRGKAPGDQIQLQVERADGSGTETVTVTLAPRPDDDTVGFLGVATTTRDLKFDEPFPVTIDSGAVGGPSAGLAFTLGVIDRLTPEGITHGRRVAVTGTIDPNGFVGPIGGVEQKTVAVRRAGADVWIVPSSEADAARKFAGDMQVVGVDTLDEALAALASLGDAGASVAQAPSGTAGG